jgi:hypothetical protein
MCERFYNVDNADGFKVTLINAETSNNPRPSKCMHREIGTVTNNDSVKPKVFITNWATLIESSKAMRVMEHAVFKADQKY